MKALRLQIKQPSPNWSDSTLRHICCYSKKADPNAAIQNDSRPQTSQSTTASDPFSAFKSKIKSNLKGQPAQPANQSQPKDNVYPAQQPYIEDVRKVDIFTK